MKKTALQLILCLGLLLTLSGCFFKTADELYALPELPEAYKQLQIKLDEVMGELDAEYAAPLTGSNTATVQLQDLDGDGEAEATVAFFRVNSNEEPLRIYIFRQEADGTYEKAYALRGDGTAIDSISFVDLDGDGMKEVLVSWQISARVHTLTAYQLGVADAIELVHTAYNETFAVYDLDRDNQQELLVLQADDTGEGSGRVEYYNFENGQMVLAAAAPMSRGASAIAAGGVRRGYLRGNIPALYVGVMCGDAAVTDIYAMREGVFTNVTLNPETGVSGETMRYYNDVAAQDINSDGVLELPKPVALSDNQPAQNSASSFWLIYWRQFDVDGNAYTVQINYHNLIDGWYLNLPENWVDQIAMARDDSQSARGERAVVFYLMREGEMETSPQEFLRIYRLTGSNRSTRARLGNRFVLLEEDNITYAAEFTDVGWNSGLNEDNLADYFSIIRKEWSNQ